MAFKRSGVRSPLSPPNLVPSIDKKNFIGGWFYYALKGLEIRGIVRLGQVGEVVLEECFFRNDRG